MAKQLVVAGNRVLAYGEDCFISVGGAVICPSSGKAYQNASVVECEAIPTDIEAQGYEYHAGQFVPCAPFGVGDGNMAVVCGEDCKAVKDSGIPAQWLGKFAEVSYKGTGTYGAGAPNTVTLDFVPKYVVIVAQYFVVTAQGGPYMTAADVPCTCFLSGANIARSENMQCSYVASGAVAGAENIYCNISTNKITWYSTSGAGLQCNAAGKAYKLYAWG